MHSSKKSEVLHACWYGGCSICCLPNLWNAFEKTCNPLFLLPPLILPQRAVVLIQHLSSLLSGFGSNDTYHFLPLFHDIFISLRNRMVFKQVILWLFHLFLQLVDLLPIFSQIEVNVERIEQFFIPRIQILLKFSNWSLLIIDIVAIGNSDTLCEVV